jgi:hypothetical protein
VALDFEALMPGGPMRLADLVEGTRRVVGELVGVAEGKVPEPRLLADRRYLQGRPITPGWEMGPEHLAATWLGPGAPNPHIDVVDEGGQPAVRLLPTDAGGGGLVCTPRRAPVPLLWGMGFALAAALAGPGRYIDNDLQLTWEKGITDDDGPAFVAATKLPRHEATFDQACREYLRQFDRLASWDLA